MKKGAGETGKRRDGEGNKLSLLLVSDSHRPRFSNSFSMPATGSVSTFDFPKEEQRHETQSF